VANRRAEAGREQQATIWRPQRIGGRSVSFGQRGEQMDWSALFARLCGNQEGTVQHLVIGTVEVVTGHGVIIALMSS
jgi:hypothetical protein